MDTEKEIQALRKQIVLLETMLENDELCNILNRKSIIKKVNTSLKKGVYGMMIVIDVDNFRNVNNFFGHSVGDKALRLIANAIKQCINKDDLAGRIGGDEFIIYTKSQDDTKCLINKLHKSVKKINLLDIGGPTLSITVGVHKANLFDSYETLFDYADQQLMASKRSRKKYINLLEEKVIYEESKLLSLESFQSLCQSTEDSYLLFIITMSELDNTLPNISKLEPYINLMYDSIRLNIQHDDFFTRFSSNQFLVFCRFLEPEEAHLVRNRIHKAYRENILNKHELKTKIKICNKDILNTFRAK